MTVRRSNTYRAPGHIRTLLMKFIHSRKAFYPTICLILFSLGASGQDIEQMGDQKLFGYSGGISATTTFYHVEGMPRRRDPFFWQLNANLNLNLLGIINAPFSFTLSQQNKSFSQPQPFNRFGISPTYKGITLHLGHRTLNFSDYTLAGNLFFGVGLEYKPKDHPLRVSALYGRFAKPVDKYAEQGQVYAEPTYRRMGYGVKVGFEGDDQHAALIFFRAADDVNSIVLEDSLVTGTTPTPEENLVVGIEGGFRFLDRFSFDAEYAYSLFSRDRRIPELFIDSYTFINNLGGLFTPNASSSFTNAFRSQLAYQGNRFQMNLGYRRVDPGYTTHGSSFLNNDLEDITVGLSVPVFSNRVTLNVNGGLQHNNLEKQNTSEVRRVIFSSSASISASEKLNINLNYSNFSTSTHQMLIRSNILSDTLEFYQVTRSAMATVNYLIGSENRQSTLFITGNFQDATDNQGNGSKFMSGNAGYAFKIGEMWSANSSFSINNSEASGFINLTAGPVLGLNRSFFDNRVRSNFSYSLLNSYINGTRESHINNVRWSGNWSPGKRHAISMNAFYIFRNARSQEEGQGTIHEVRLTFNYSFRI